MSEAGVEVLQKKLLVLEHVDSPSYISAVATGISISGPSGDGFLHLTFFRDIMRPVAEEFTLAPESADPSNVKFTLESRGGGEPKMYREDIATISISPGAVEAVIVALKASIDRSKG